MPTDGQAIHTLQIQNVKVYDRQLKGQNVDVTGSQMAKRSMKTIKQNEDKLNTNVIYKDENSKI